MNNIDSSTVEMFSTTLDDSVNSSVILNHDLIRMPVSRLINVTDEHNYQKPESTLLFYIVFSSVFLVGIVGNSMLVLIFIRHKSMRTAPNTYMFNLAVTDLLTTMNCAASPLLASLGYDCPILCKISRLAVGSLMGVSAFTLIALSIDRYYAIVHPLQNKVSSKKFTLFIVIIIWMMSIFYNHVKMYFLPENFRNTCMGLQMYHPNVYFLADFLLWYVVPLFVFSYCYIMMAHQLCSNSSPLFRDDVDPLMHSRLCARRRIAVAVLLLVAMYAVFYLPFSVVSLKLHFEHDQARNIKWTSLNNILLCLGCLHNSFNPMVLYFLSKSFRAHFDKYLFKHVSCASS